TVVKVNADPTTGAALRRQAIRPCAGRSRRPTISVVLPARDHEAYVSRALESVVGQTWSDLEIIVVDDGSRDATLKIAKEFAAAHRSYDMEVVDQPRAGAHAAINRGVELARGDFVAILESADFYHPMRLSALHRELETSGVRLAFSGVELVGEDGSPLPAADPLGVRFRAKLAEARTYPNLGYALLDFNLAVSSGNLFFRRELFDMVGGFRDPESCHAWDFVLAAMRYTSPTFVEEGLYFYRYGVRRSDAFVGLDGALPPEAEQVLGLFFGRDREELRRNVPSRRLDGAYFDAFVRTHGYEKYLGSGADSDSDVSHPTPGSNKGWYGDGWVAPGLRLVLRRDGSTFRLRGRLPSFPQLRGQVLDVILNRHPIGCYDIAPGPFELSIPVDDHGSVLEIEIRASRSFVPAVDLGSDDPRRLAFVLDEVLWESADQRTRP
ncbi:MAG: glycosyltransferase family 2 protein, partial [Candidatus Binatia bacterium]